jgi:glycerophosphoryl diester phosphodiesterase
MTADGVLIVLHDDTLDRTTRGPGCTGRALDRTLSEVRTCDAGSWFNETRPERAQPAFSKERVPELAEVLARYRGRARFYIETKNPDDAPGMEYALVRLLGQHELVPAGDRAPLLVTPATLPTVIVQSFSEASLRVLRRHAPAVPRVQLVESGLSAVEIEARLDRIAAYAQAIGPARGSVDARIIAAAHQRGIAVHPYTVNDEAEMHRLIAAGIDGMFTDDPALLLRLGRDPAS